MAKNNALALFDNNQLPAHVAGFLDQTEGNIVDRATVPTLSFTGKVWSVSINGEVTKVQKTSEEGDLVPVPIMRVWVLDYAKRRGRTYYEGAYDPSATKQPDCWSEDGITPHESVKEKQNSKCEGCPMSIKGSKVTEQNKAVTACSQHRIVVVKPVSKVDIEPLRLKLPATSDWDGDNPHEAEGWFAFNNYTELLRSRGVKHTAALVTKMKFDPNVAYPKVLFSPDRWTGDGELAQLKEVLAGDEVKKLLTGYTPAGVDGKPISQADTPWKDTGVAEPKAAPKPEPEVDAAAKRAAAAEEAEAAKKAEAKAARKAAKDKAAAEAAAAAAKAAAAAAADDDEDDEDAIVIPTKAAKPEVKAAPAKAEAQPAVAQASSVVPPDVAAILDTWGDD